MKPTAEGVKKRAELRLVLYAEQEVNILRDKRRKGGLASPTPSVRDAQHQHPLTKLKKKKDKL